MDLISVIVPVYKTEKYLRTCIESIQKQTYDNLEIILVDDGSPDACPQICDEYEKKDDRIIVLHNHNQGVAAARNIGLERANGQYICFVDSDDYVYKRYIEKLYKTLINNDADMAVCGFMVIYDINDTVIKHTFPVSYSKMCTGEQALRALITEQGLIYIVLWNKIYKKYIWDNLRFPEGKIHEDEAVVHRVLAKCKKVVCIENELYFYRQVNGSIMHNNIKINYLHKYSALADRILFLKDYFSLEELRKVCYQYWYRYLDDFYLFYRNSDARKELRDMKYSLQKVLPVGIQCGLFTKKDIRGIVLFMISPWMFRKIFR